MTHDKRSNLILIGCTISFAIALLITGFDAGNQHYGGMILFFALSGFWAYLLYVLHAPIVEEELPSLDPWLDGVFNTMKPVGHAENVELKKDGYLQPRPPKSSTKIPVTQARSRKQKVDVYVVKKQKVTSKKK